MGLETAIIVGSAIAAVGAVGASGINAASTSSTNKKQEEMFHEQMAYQTSEREATQEYNTPENQRQRYEQAGINPYLALGQMDAGNTTAQTAPSAPQLQVPQYGDIISALGDSVKSGISDTQQLEMYQLGLEQQRVDARYKLTEKLLQLNSQRADLVLKNQGSHKLDKEIELLDNQIKQTSSDLEFSQKSLSDRLAFQHSQTKIAQLDEQAKQLGNDYQKWFNQFSKERGAKELQQLNASIANTWQAIKESGSRIDLNNKNGRLAAANEMLTNAQKRGVHLDNQQKVMLRGYLVEGMALDNKAKKYNTDNPSYFEREILNPAFSLGNQIGSNTGMWSDRPTSIR